jgi:hypothetical protein
MRRNSFLAVLAVLTVLAAAIVYETLVAVRVVELGSLPGEGPPGAGMMGLVAAIGLLAPMLVSAVLVGVGTTAPALSALLAPAAGAYLLARFYSFDPYYLPSQIRYSERDFVPPIVVFALAALCVGAGLMTLRKRRVGLALGVPLILVCALTAFFSGLGH